jgi:hypothetical protein
MKAHFAAQKNVNSANAKMEGPTSMQKQQAWNGSYPAAGNNKRLA